MAVFSVNISDEDVGRVISAVCGNYGYQAQVENPDFDPSTAPDAQTNPETILNPESELIQDFFSVKIIHIIFNIKYFYLISS